jgi:DNA-binding transcriptional MerR regulator
MKTKKYIISEVAKLTDCSARTVRYYVQRGLIPPPKGSGRNSFYTDLHIKLIKIIKQLQSEYLPLHKIKEKLQDEKFISKFSIIDKKPKQSIKKIITRSPYVKVNITDEIELHYQEYLPGTTKAKIEKIIKFAEDILK